MKLFSLKTLIPALALSLAGCNTLHKFIAHADSQPAHIQPLPDDYTLTGKTLIDFEVIQPVRVVDSTVVVQVKRAGETTWRTLNQYEVKLDTVGAGGGGVIFQRQVNLDPFSGTLFLTGKPVAPKGTEYSIRSILMTTSHSLY